MSVESGFRAIFARADGGVSVLCASSKRQGAASMDALLSRAERKALRPGMAMVERVPLDKAPRDRRLRNAWVIQDGQVRVDLAQARALRARQWVREGAELRRFIQDELLPYARIMGERDGAARLQAANAQIDRALEDLSTHIHTMTEAELASHVPDWPRLTAGGSGKPTPLAEPETAQPMERQR
jgi:hypothetical protein